jgi:hypothetical protein
MNPAMIAEEEQSANAADYRRSPQEVRRTARPHRSGAEFFLLEFHNDDGFPPRRCDHLMFFGSRNRELVSTIAASIWDPRLPDEKHIRQPSELDRGHLAVAEALSMRDEPASVAVRGVRACRAPADGACRRPKRITISRDLCKQATAQQPDGQRILF